MAWSTSYIQRESIDYCCLHMVSSVLAGPNDKVYEVNLGMKQIKVTRYY